MRLVFLTLILLSVTGCGRDPVFTEMSDSTFVQTMIALRKLPVGEGLDRAARNRARDSILQVFRVTAAQVESTAVRLATDPAKASEIWRAIENPLPAQPVPAKKNGA